MKKVSVAIDAAEIGIAMYNLILPHDGYTGGPKFQTKKYNPRETSKQSLKEIREQFERSGGFLKDRPEFAILMAIRPCWITNLDEIKNCPFGTPLPRIQWAPEVAEELAELLNGNHRLHVLLEMLFAQREQLKEVRARMKEVEDQQKQQVSISKKKLEQHKKDQELETTLVEILKKEGLFSVKLYDLGKQCETRNSQQVETYVFAKLQLKALE